MKNPCGKTRPKDNPYAIWKSPDGWTWNVLKKNQSPEGERLNRMYASWYCFVTSPFMPTGEYGDVYISDIKRHDATLTFEG